MVVLETEGKGGLRTFIDDSGAVTNPTINEAGRVFNIVSGSISAGINTAAASEDGGGLDYFTQTKVFSYLTQVSLDQVMVWILI